MGKPFHRILSHNRHPQACILKKILKVQELMFISNAGRVKV